MADLNNTLVRGNLRVTSDATISGNINATNVQASTFNGGSAIFDGQNNQAPLILQNGISGYREGLRIMPYGDWSDILLAGNDANRDQGTSANSWFIGNNNGNFHITRNGSSDGGTASLKCVNNVWTANGYELITSGNIGSQSVNYATSAGSAPANGGTADYIWCKGSSPDDAFVGGKLSSFYSWNNGGPVNTYSIGITVGGHPSDPYYGWQIAQSLWDDDLYYRRRDQSTGSFTSWLKVLNPTNGLSREPWWNESDSHSANDLGSGITFAYTTHGTPTTGTLVSFAGIGGSCESYRLQLQGAYGSDQLFFRNRNGDNGTWNSWREIIHSGNIGSQNVNYASSSGNADYPTGFVSRNTTSDWSGVSGALLTDWSSASSGDVMFKDDGGKINVITDGRFYQGIDIYGASKRVLDEYDLTNTTWGNADTVDGHHASDFIQGSPGGPRDFSSGTLITTDIDYSVTNGDAFYLEIKGDGYGAGSYFTIAQGYIYNDTIVNYTVNNLGVAGIFELYAINVDGHLCFWFPRLAYWQSFSAICNKSNTSDYKTNHVTSITDSTKPSGTKEVNIAYPGHLYSNINSYNIGSQSVANADTVDNEHASAFVHKSVTTLSNGADLNTVLETGFYAINGSYTNGPADNVLAFSQLLVGHSGNDTHFQMGFPFTSSRIFFRNGNNNGTWKDWQEVITTGNISSYASKVEIVDLR